MVRLGALSTRASVERVPTTASSRLQVRQRLERAGQRDYVVLVPPILGTPPRCLGGDRHRTGRGARPAHRDTAPGRTEAAPAALRRVSPEGDGEFRLCEARASPALPCLHVRSET